MPNHRNAVLAGLAAACLLFLCLAVAARLQPLVALVIAIAGGAAVLGAVGRRRPTPTEAQVTVVAPVPPPVRFDEEPITGIRLPSALADYTFAFAAKVLWHPVTAEVIGASEVAVNEIVRRAREITERHDPSQVTLIEPDLAVALGTLLPDPDGQVQVRAEAVSLQLPPEDQRRLDHFATLRKQEGLWEYERRYEMSKRQYLRTDVLKDAGSAVVWWLAKHEDQPKQVADSIDVLTRLAWAANNADGDAFEAPTAPQTPPNPPQTPAERFDAFLDSLDPVPNANVRLLLTSQVARFVDGHDQKAADEMRRRHSEPGDSDVDDGYWDYPGSPDGDQPSPDGDQPE
jgi:hypothetical protein